MSFQADTENPNAPLALDLAPGREALLVAFGGMAGKLGMPPFEFFKLTAGLPLDRIFVRDVNRLWYHRGLPGLGSDIDGVAAALGRLIATRRSRRLVVVGNSGGGYAALLFGHLLDADEVHAFAPKAFVSPLRRLLLGDLGPKRRILRLCFAGGAQRRYFDATKVLSRSRSKTVFHVHYAAGHRCDAHHAGLLGRLPQVVPHPYAHARHTLVRWLKESGRLREILLEALRLPPREAEDAPSTPVVAAATVARSR